MKLLQLGFGLLSEGTSLEVFTQVNKSVAIFELSQHIGGHEGLTKWWDTAIELAGLVIIRSKLFKLILV